MLRPSCNTRWRCWKSTPIPHPLSLITLVAALAVAGCGTAQPYVYEDNYLTYHHPFTEAAADTVRQNAEKTCAKRKQDAVKTRSVCSMKECATHYQCMDRN